MKKQMQNVWKIKRKVLSLILVTALVTTGLNLDTMSQSIYASQTQKNENRKTQEKVTVVKELVDERTENSNTYLLSDGSKQAEIFTDSIRFEKDGELVDYNPKLVKIDSKDKEILDKKTSENIRDYLFVNESGDSKQYFPKKLDKDTGIVLNHGKYVVGMTPELEEGQSYAPDKESDTVTYVSDERGISYEYISMKDGVKENIILNSKPEQYTFEYKIETKNTYLKQRKNDRGILVCDSRTDKTVGYIAPPNIKDGDGNTDYENVTYSLIKKNNETVITVSVNEMYFEKEDLKYPVTVDPTMQWMSDKLTTTGVWSVPFMADSTLSQNPLTVSNYLLNTYPYNSENRIYLDTKNLLNGNAFTGDKAPLKGMYIESATLTISEAKKPAHYPTGTVQIKRALGEWDPSAVTWNTQPELSEDYIAETVCTGVEGEHHTLDITDWVQDIADEKFENYGLVFTCPSKGMSAILYGPQFKYILDENGRPKESLYMTIRVNYREMEAYNASVELGAEYNSETGKIETKITDQNKLPEGITISGYKIYGRKNNSSNFTVIQKGTDIGEPAQIDLKGADRIDLRACILYSDGRVRPSNIVTLKKMDETDEEGQGDGESTVTYEQTTIDTDGDGLEDGYEIWDFKTLWNTEIGVDEEGNKIYDLDTDKDGFPDSYEVFTLGTDPAVANEEGMDSDGDGWSDLTEYQKGTDPWLKDSDFDGTNDNGDKNPRKTSGHTNPAKAAAAKVHKGLYEREYSETEDGVTTTYITNIYRGNIRQIEIDYGNTSLNKTMKYFYDEKGNNTAIIEAYDKVYDSNGEQTICITYTYDADGNVTFICDQSTKYTMTYENGEMSELKVGDNRLIQHGKNILENNAGTDGDISGIADDGVIDIKESTTTYGNNQSMRTVTTTYKREEGNTTDAAAEDKIYYNGSNDVSYVIEYNNEGKIIKLTDSTGESEDVVYTYSYQDNVTKTVRSDGFTKEVITSESEDGSVSTTNTAYTFKDLKNSNTTYTSVYKTDNSDESKSVLSNALFNNDKFTTEISSEGKNVISTLYSDSYKKNIIKTTEKEVSNTKTTFDVDIYAEDKAFEYTYDRAGNITSIKDSGKILYEYTYDAHGRLISQKDFTINECHEYIYNATGNIYADWKYPLDGNGSKISAQGSVKYSEYENEQWPDQLTSYDEKSITYDEIGNPVEYWNGMKFQWARGRQLAKVTLDNNSEVIYKYNKDGLRTHKETEKISTDYEWDENRLIRETVTYKATGKKYDVWYFFDANNQVAGFEYSEISGMDNSLKKTRVYYEKNVQGDVIGLLDSRGAEIAKYAYDAWGNVTSKMCYEGYETPYALNHITYRGYYRDDESGFYYLQSRYYDAEVGRFLNADDVRNLGASKTIWGYNLYSYCESNPIMYTDATGEALINIILAGIFGIVGWYFGDWIAYKIVGKKNWKYWILRSAIAVGGAAVGWFAGSLIAKYVVTYLRNNPAKIFQLINKLGAKTFYNAMMFLGINPFTLAMDSSKFVAVAKALNSKSITLGYEWARQLYYKAISLGFKIKLDRPHGGYTWHIHLSGGNGKLSNLHIQVVKSVWDFLSKLIK